MTIALKCYFTDTIRYFMLKYILYYTFYNIKSTNTSSQAQYQADENLGIKRRRAFRRIKP